MKLYMLALIAGLTVTLGMALLENSKCIPESEIDGVIQKAIRGE